MEITYFGHSSFKIKGKDTSIVTDPYDPEAVGLKFVKTDANLVTVSHQHQDHNNIDLVTDTQKVFSAPGEYEISGVSLIGYPTFHDNNKGADRGANICFVIEIDKFRIAHLGDLGHLLTDDMVGDVGEIDILMIPIGGIYTIDSNQAIEIVKKISPHVVLPMHYKIDGMKETFKDLEKVETFVTNLGIPSETLPKLIVKDPTQWADEEQKVVILEKK